VRVLEVSRVSTPEGILRRLHDDRPGGARQQRQPQPGLQVEERRGTMLEFRADDPLMAQATVLVATINAIATFPAPCRIHGPRIDPDFPRSHPKTSAPAKTTGSIGHSSGATSRSSPCGRRKIR